MEGRSNVDVDRSIQNKKTYHACLLENELGLNATSETSLDFAMRRLRAAACPKDTHSSPSNRRG